MLPSYKEAAERPPRTRSQRIKDWFDNYKDLIGVLSLILILIGIFVFLAETTIKSCPNCDEGCQIGDNYCSNCGEMLRSIK